ncbi:MAG: hypothetical protein EHM55_01325 [Acidobacteria bacterium]|nr:MAG: hypothetical protein EHM55_01325 [Acidobacteriota bacterium]
MRPNTIVGFVCLVSVAAFTACQPSQTVDAAAAREPEQLTLDVALPAPEPAAPKAAQPRKATAKNVKSAAASKATVPTASTESADATPAMDATPLMESRQVAANQSEESIATTIAGCLVRDDDLFQLKDTDGEHAPKSRSWKSGFIKKGSARVGIVDAGNRFDLGSHVGHRVSVSGTLTDREMHARSVRATTERCD